MDNDRRKLCQGSCARLRGERGKPGNRAHKRGLNTKIHLAVDARGVPVRCVVTDGVTADCAKAGELVERVVSDAEGKPSDRCTAQKYCLRRLSAENLGMEVVIPPRKIQRKYDQKAYKIRRLVENAFLYLKRWRGVVMLFYRMQKKTFF